MTAKKSDSAPYEAGDDQLFRELVPEFSADFVRLAVPDVARQLDLSAIEFRLCEYFSDSPRGGHPRRPDLVAEAPILADPTRKVTLHSEIEYKYLEARIPRLLDYNRLVAMREGRPVHTIVFYVHGGSAGVKRMAYREKSLGLTTNVLHYVSFGPARATLELDRAAVDAPGLVGDLAPLGDRVDVQAHPGDAELGGWVDLGVPFGAGDDQLFRELSQEFSADFVRLTPRT